MKESYYEQSFKLHSENARLRKRIEELESALSIDKLRKKFEADIQKHLRREEKLLKECDRYHQLWQNAVKELRSKGDVLELLIQIEVLEKSCSLLRQENAALRKYKRKQKQAVSFRCDQSVEFLCDAMSIIETRKLQGANIYQTVREAFIL